MSICRLCKKSRPDVAFSLKKNSTTKLATCCDTCRQKPAVAWASLNPDKMREAVKRFSAKGGARAGRLRSRYGLSHEHYDAMLAAQHMGCAICGAEQPGGRYANFHVDHCHHTGKVRGLLCTNCNRGLGYFKDDSDRLVLAASYVRQ